MPVFVNFIVPVVAVSVRPVVVVASKSVPAAESLKVIVALPKVRVRVPVPLVENDVNVELKLLKESVPRV